MVKKLLVLVAFAVSVNFSAIAQCTPDQNTAPGFAPTVLPDAMVGVNYNQIVQFKLPTDTSYLTYTGTIQSLTFVGVTGLPAGFIATCNKYPNTTYSGGEIGCLSISGTATSGMEKTYSMVLNLKVSGILQPGNIPMVNLPLDVPITMKVVASNGLSVIKAPFFALSQREEDLVLLNPANGKLSVAVFDMLGRTVKTGNYQSTKGEATYINISHLEKGIYFVNLQLNGKQETIKISKGFY